MPYPRQARMVFRLAVGLLVLSGFATFLLIIRFRSGEKAVLHSREVQAMLGDLDFAWVKMGRARAAYIATGNEEYARAFTSSVPEVYEAIHRLNTVTEGDSRQKQFCSKLETLTRQRIDLLQRSVSLKQTEPLNQEGQDKISRESVPIASDATSVVQQMKDEEQLLLQKRGVHSAQMTPIVGGALLFSFAVAIVLLVIPYRWLSSELAARRRAEEATRESEERLKIALESAEMGVWSIASDDGKYERSLRHDQILGYSSLQPEWKLNVLLNRVLTADLDSVKKAFDDASRNKRLSVECRILWPDQSIHWISLQGRVYSDQTGSPERMMGVVFDITEQKQAAEASIRDRVETAQFENQQLLQVIVDNSPAVIYAKDLDGRYLLVSHRFTELFHVPEEKALGHTDYDFFSASSADAFRAVDERVIAGLTAITEEEIVPQEDGLHTYISVKCPLWTRAGAPYGIFGISTDITEKKKIEKELRASEERTRRIVETALDGVVTIDQKGLITEWNSQAELIFGWKREEVLGQPLSATIIPQQYRQAHWDGLQRYLATGTSSILNRRIELTALNRRRQEFPIEISITPIKENGTVVFSAFIRDITERRTAERRVQAQMERLKLLHHITRAIGEREDLRSIYQVMLRNLEDNISFDFGCICDYEPLLNSLSISHLGVGSQGVAAGLEWNEKTSIPIDRNGLSRCIEGYLVYEPDVTESTAAFPAKLASAGLRSLVIAPLQVENKVFGVLVVARKDRRSFSSGECEFLQQLSEHAALAARQIHLHVSLQRAYDDLRSSQQTAQQQERLRALGQMASGIAHDINNAISPVALYTESLLETERNLSTNGRRCLETIQRSIEDVAETIARMREFYRQREPQASFTPIDLSSLVQQAIDLTRARWCDMPQQQGVLVHVRTNFAQDAPLIGGVESEIREALINLIFNAVDAMPEGGTLSFTTRLVGSIELASGELASAVQVEIADTGVGMKEDIRLRCTEPFFTTKGERGTGLGLAMVYGVMQRHGAEMEIESWEDRGTTIKLNFPLLSPIAKELQNEKAPLPVPTGLDILVIDDDPLLLRSLLDVLGTDGHNVTTANGGREGIEIFLSSLKEGPRFSLVITDLGMPYVDGRQVARTIKGTSPATPVILLTGWGQRLTVEGDIPVHVDHVISKPPKLRTMREVLARCLAKKEI